jgi:peptide methionine sulfoxide reductase MsrB
LAGTHLGHNLPDKKGNRYCINLVSIAGRPLEEQADEEQVDDEEEEAETTPNHHNPSKTR